MIVRKSSALFLAVVALLFACTKSEPQASPVVVPTSPIPTSVSPSVMMVGDCEIVPQTDCPDAELTLVSLQGADLHGANLSGANLHASNLRRVDFTGADLTRTDITDSDLTKAKLVGADLAGASLKDANLTGTNLTGATLKLSQLNNTRLCGTILPDGTKDDTSCAEPSVSPSSSVSPAAGVVITKFAAPSAVVCPSSPPTAVVTAKIHYATTGATSVGFMIDGESPGAGAGYDPKRGVASLDFPCNRSSHRYTIVASADTGKPVKESTIVYRT